MVFLGCFDTRCHDSRKMLPTSAVLVQKGLVKLQLDSF